MPLRFRRRLGIAPGLSLNLGKRGASVSIGRRGARVTFGRSGTRETIGLPGTGLSYTTTQSRSRGRRPGIVSQVVGLAIGLLLLWLLLVGLGLL